MGMSDRPGRVATAHGLLITQRSRVQIPPPLPRPQGPFSNREGAFCIWFVNVALVHAASPEPPPAFLRLLPLAPGPSRQQGELDDLGSRWRSPEGVEVRGCRTTARGPYW
jgi:hypothetical protein